MNREMMQDKLGTAGTLPLQMSKATKLDILTGSVHNYMTRVKMRLRVWNDGRLFVFLQAGEDIDRRAEVEYAQDGIAWNPKLLETKEPNQSEGKSKATNDLGRDLPQNTWAWFLVQGQPKDAAPRLST